jgi:hypothetical protein
MVAVSPNLVVDATGGVRAASAVTVKLMGVVLECLR